MRTDKHVAINAENDINIAFPSIIISVPQILQLNEMLLRSFNQRRRHLQHGAILQLPVLETARVK